MWHRNKRFNSHDCFMTGQETYDLLIPVTSWTGLTEYETLPTWQQVHQNYQMWFVMCKKQTFNKMDILQFILQIKYNLYLCLKCNVPS